MALLTLSPRDAVTQSLLYGSLNGTVRDTAGRLVADADVRIVDRVSGAAREFVTGRDGAFRAAFLSPSAYDVRVEALGYRPAVHRAVAVLAGGVVSLPVVLRAASPPVIAVDTIRTGAVRPTAMTWLQERGYADLVGASRTATDVAALSVVSSDAGVEGLPWRYTDLMVDGAMAAGAGAAPARGAELASVAVPSNAIATASAGALGADVETGGSGVGLRAFSMRGGAVRRPRGALYGGTSDLGLALRFDGPLQPDTAHVVAGIEYHRAETRRPAVFAAGDAEGAAILTTARDDHGIELGALAAEMPTLQERASGYARLDWDIADRYSISLRGAGSHLRMADPAFPSLPAPGLGSSQSATALQTSVNVRTRLTDHLSSELRISGDFLDASADAPSLATTRFAGRGLTLGGPGLAPFAERRLSPQLNALLHWDVGRHRLKFGAQLASHRVETQGVTDAGAEYRFGDAADLTALAGSWRSVPVDAPSGNLRVRDAAFLLQDAWRVAEGLDLTLGLRFDAQRIPGSAFETNGAWLAASGLDTGQPQSARSAFAPRFGLRWSLGERREWTIDGSAGVFHDLPDFRALGEAASRDVGAVVRGRVGALGGWPSIGDVASQPLLGTTVTMLGSDFEGPRTRRGSFGVTRDAGPWSTFVRGIYRFTDFMDRRVDLNLPLAPVGEDQYGRPLLGDLVQLGTLVVPVPGSNRRFGGFDAVHAIDVTGYSEYRAVVVGVERVTDGGLTLGLQYAFSSTLDNLVDGAEDAWSDGRADTDAPHRLLASAEWSPTSSGALRIGVVYRLASGEPFTATFRDGVDANGDGFVSADPAFVDETLPGMAALLAEWACLEGDAGGFARRNGCRGDATHRVDLRISMRLLDRRSVPLELVVDAIDLTGSARPLVDRALVLVDRTGTLVRDPITGVTTVPLVVNPNFGGALAERSPGALFRVGLRIGR